MSTWRRNACFSRGIVSSFVFFQNTLIPVFLRFTAEAFSSLFLHFLGVSFICHPTEFWIIEPLVFQIFLVFYAYCVDDV